MATSRLRPLPDFLVIGAKRSGTTSLYRYLLEHPQVFPLFPSARRLPMKANLKGVHYFDTKAARSVAWYRSHFPASAARAAAERRLGGPTVVGEASPYYLSHPIAPFRARRLVPEARLIVLLRHPLHRAFSHYKEQVRNGTEHLSFEEALDAEAGRLDGEVERMRADRTYNSVAHEHQSYLLQSDYLAALRVWYELFPAEQILVLRSEDFFAEPQAIYDQTLAFLGLPPFPLADQKVWNATNAACMGEAARVRLEALFAPRVRALEEFLGRPMWPLVEPGSAEADPAAGAAGGQRGPATGRALPVLTDQSRRAEA